MTTSMLIGLIISNHDVQHTHALQVFAAKYCINWRFLLITLHQSQPD